MNNDKKCLLIHPSGKREYVYKNNEGTYENNYKSDLLKYIDNLNISNEDRGIRDNMDHCTCLRIPIHDCHGIMGIAKYVKGKQVDYEDGDFERAIVYELDIKKKIDRSQIIFVYLIIPAVLCSVFCFYKYS